MENEDKERKIYLKKFRLTSFFISLFFVFMLVNEAFSLKFRIILFLILEGIVILANIYATFKKKQFFTEWP